MAVSMKMKCSAVREELAPLRRLQLCWVLAIRVYFCRGPVCRSGACHLQNVPLDHLFLLISSVSEQWRGKGKPGVISTDVGGYLLDSVWAISTSCLSFQLKCVFCGRAICRQ